MKPRYLIALAVFSLPTWADPVGHQVPASVMQKIPVNVEASAAIKKPLKTLKGVRSPSPLFRDQSVIAQHDDDAPSLRIESWSRDERGFLITGFNSAGDRMSVRVPEMVEGGYANFFGALFVFDGSEFHRLSQENVSSYKLTNRYIAESAN